METIQLKSSIGVKRLSTLMFFQLFAFGAVLPFMSLYLTKTLGFSGLQSGIILATTAFSNLIGPLLSAYVIDRKMHAKHIYILVMAIMVLASISLIFVREFIPVLISVFFLYASFGPALNIVHSVAFQDLKNRDGNTNHFGKIRVWGTIAWIICGFFATGIWFIAEQSTALTNSADQKSLAFILAGLGALACILVFSKIPRGELLKDPPEGFIPKSAFAVIKEPIVLGYGIIFALSQVMETFYYFGQGPYLTSIGVSEAFVPAALTLGQTIEIPMLFIFSALLKRVGFYNIFLIGAITQLTRYILFISGDPILGLISYALNGIIFACIWNAITMFIDKFATDKSRNGVHQLIGLFFGGSSWLIGQLGAGLIFDTLDKTKINFTNFWLIPLCGSLVVLAIVIGLRKATLKKL